MNKYFLFTEDGEEYEFDTKDQLLNQLKEYPLDTNFEGFKIIKGKELKLNLTFGIKEE